VISLTAAINSLDEALDALGRLEESLEFIRERVVDGSVKLESLLRWIDGANADVERIFCCVASTLDELDPVDTSAAGAATPLEIELPSLNDQDD